MLETEFWDRLLGRQKTADTEDGSRFEVHLRTSFRARLSQAQENVPENYNRLKNALLSYKGVRVRTSWACDTVKCGRRLLGKINIKGKTLILCLAVSPADYDLEKLHATDVSDKALFADTPLELRIRNEKTLAVALGLLPELMQKWEIPPAKKPSDEDFRLAPKSTEELIRDGWIRVSLSPSKSPDAVVFSPELREMFDAVVGRGTPEEKEHGSQGTAAAPVPEETAPQISSAEPQTEDAVATEEPQTEETPAPVSDKTENSVLTASGKAPLAEDAHEEVPAPEESDGRDPAAEDAVREESPAEEPAGNPPEVALQTEKAPAQQPEDWSKYDVRYRTSFLSRLIQGEDRVQDDYTVIKNALLSYKGVKARTSWQCETFKKGRALLAKLNVKGKTLYAYLALSPASLNLDDLRAEDVTGKPVFGDTPLLVRIRNDKTLETVLSLVALLMEQNGIEKQKKFTEEDYHLPYEENSALIERGLIRVIRDKKAAATESDAPVAETVTAESPAPAKTPVSEETEPQVPAAEPQPADIVATEEPQTGDTPAPVSDETGAAASEALPEEPSATTEEGSVEEAGVTPAPAESEVPEEHPAEETQAEASSEKPAAEPPTAEATGDTPDAQIGHARSLFEETLAFSDGLVPGHNDYAALLRAMCGGNITVALRKRYLLRAIDERWVRMVEDSLPALDTVTRNPSRFIEEKEQILPIEMTKRVSGRSIRHLAQHTDYISEVRDDEVVPTKLLNVFREETNLTYENKFLNTLITRLYAFIDRRYRLALRRGADEKNTALTFRNSFEYENVRANIDLRIELSEQPAEGEVRKNTATETPLWERVVRLHDIATAYTASPFARSMGHAGIRPPVMRTNALLKNPNLRQCLLLWEFIESYEEAGFGILIDEALERPDEELVDELNKALALQYTLFCQKTDRDFSEEKTLDSRTGVPIRPTVTEKLPEVPAPVVIEAPAEPAQEDLLQASDDELLAAIDVALAAAEELRRRKAEEAARIKEQEKAPAEAAEIVAPDAEEPLPAADGETEAPVAGVHYRTSFLARLIQCEDPAPENYNIIKNALLSYKGVRARTSWACETFKRGRQMIAKLNIKGKTLILCLALRPDDVDAQKYKFDDVSEKSAYRDVPVMLRIRSAKSCTAALALIAELMLSLSVPEAAAPSAEDFRLPFADTDELIARGLIKVDGKRVASAPKAAPFEKPTAKQKPEETAPALSAEETQTESPAAAAVTPGETVPAVSAEATSPEAEASQTPAEAPTRAAEEPPAEKPADPAPAETPAAPETTGETSAEALPETAEKAVAKTASEAAEPAPEEETEPTGETPEPAPAAPPVQRKPTVFIRLNGRVFPLDTDEMESRLLATATFLSARYHLTKKPLSEKYTIVRGLSPLDMAMQGLLELYPTDDPTHRFLPDEADRFTFDDERAEYGTVIRRNVSMRVICRHSFASRLILSGEETQLRFAKLTAALTSLGFSHDMEWEEERFLAGGNPVLSYITLPNPKELSAQ